MLLGQDDHNSMVSLTRGDTIELELDENPTTGYLWQLVELPDCVSLDTDTFLLPGRARPGAAGQHRFRFRADRAGQGPVILELRRPWESTGPPERQFAATVTVDDPSTGSAGG